MLQKNAWTATGAKPEEIIGILTLGGIWIEVFLKKEAREKHKEYQE